MRKYLFFIIALLIFVAIAMATLITIEIPVPVKEVLQPLEDIFPR